VYDNETFGLGLSTENAKVIEEMEELAAYRYFVFRYFVNFVRLGELDLDFQGTLKKEHNRPTSLASPGDLYSLFYDVTKAQVHNIICISCGTIRDNPKLFKLLIRNNLQIRETVYVRFDFLCGIVVLDSLRIMIVKPRYIERFL
jgi:hypothetical protein